MRRILRLLGLITGIGPLMSALRTRWDSFDAYGTVPAGQRAILELPAGPISIAFESGNKLSKGDEADLPKVVDMSGRPLPVRFMGGFQGPSILRRSELSADVMRKRFATVDVPTDGDYAITAGAAALLIGTAGISRKPRPVAGYAPAKDPAR